MSRGLFVGTLGTILFAGPIVGVSWAQRKGEPGPPFPGGAGLRFSGFIPAQTAEAAHSAVRDCEEQAT